MEEIEIIIEAYEVFSDDGNCLGESSYLIVNGDRIETDGNHLKAVLEHLGYDATVNYI